MKKIRTRMAPSPTGFMHIGTLRTLLYNYFLAKQNNGQFILRIEDTDQSREVKGAVENIIETLNWTNVLPDEGPTFGGKYGSYIQSERLQIYKKYIEELLENKHAYWCDCSQIELNKMREEQQKNNLPTRYNGACREKNLKKGEVARLKVPANVEIEFNDLIRGKIKFPSSEIDDQILLKSDGFPTYHLAVVVDDYLMKITHVIRGEEWIPSTPKHILLYKAFGWELPRYAHLPLLLNSDKSKLSKRQGDVSVEDYIKKGYLKEALINFIALQGWNPRGDREIYSISELVELFDIAKVNKGGSVVNFEKLDWLNAHYIREKRNEELADLTRKFLKREISNELLLKLIAMIKDRMIRLTDINELTDFIFELPDYDSKILIWKKTDKKNCVIILNELKKFFENFDKKFDIEILTNEIKAWILSKKYSNGEVLWPLRVCLSGLENSPPPFDIACVLGLNEIIKRIELAIAKLS